MDIKAIIIVVSLMMLNILVAVSQEHDKIISISNQLIDLKQVDLENGMQFNDTLTFVKIGSSDSVIKNVNQQIFVERMLSGYLVAKKTSETYGYATGFHTWIEFYNQNGFKVFDRTFEDLFLEKCTIAYGQIFLRLSSEESTAFYVIDSTGKVRMELINQRVLFSHSSDNSTYALIYQESETDTYYVDIFSPKGITKLPFKNTLPHINNFSKNGKLITIMHDGFLYVYNNYGAFQWSIRSTNSFGLVFLGDGKSYLYIDYTGRRVLEMRDSGSHELLFEVSGIHYNDTLLPIKSVRIMDNWEDFCVQGSNDGEIVYDFYDKSGIFINQAISPFERRSNSVKPQFSKKGNIYNVYY